MAEENAIATQPNGAQPQQPWAYNMYNLYNPYMYPPGYNQNYYQYYAAYMSNQQQYRGFTPGGQLTNFQIPQQTPSGAPQEGKEAEPELPPLPPGPPPPQNGIADSTNQSNMYQMDHSGGQNGPVRFMMSAQRPKTLQQSPAFAQFTQPQAAQPPMSKKKRKKRNKQLQMQLQAAMQHQQQQLSHPPPLPEASPPPLPPTPPPPPLPPPVQTESGVSGEPPTVQAPPMPTVQPFQIQPATPVVHQGMKAIEEWPPSLRDYVNRCYSKCVTQMDKDRVGVILKGKLMRATNDGTIWIKEWANEPLPLLDSDSKAMMNLKAKLSRNNVAANMAHRLGPIQKMKESPRKRIITSRTYRSGNSDSSSSWSSSRSSSRSRSRSRSRTRSPTRNRRPRNTPNKKNNRNQKRNNYFANNKEQKSHFYSEFGTNEVKKEVLDKRAARFSNTVVSSEASMNFGRKKPLFVIDTGSSSPVSNEFEVSDLHIVGTCEDLEKCYLRLTSAPEAAQVRPSHVLSKSLEMVKSRWLQNRDYHYACEQLKSIRQDLTVQGIRDKLSVDVYETHARIALEKGDHAEFNQCQSQLRILHAEVDDGKTNREEFIAYRLLYYIFTKEFMDLNTLISSLTESDKKDECISHAVSVSKSWLLGNYHRIFQLYNRSPRMSSYLMDLFLDRERTKALKVIVKAYRPSVPLDFLCSELVFNDISQCEGYLTNLGGVFVDESRTKIDCKASSAIFNAS